MSTAAISVGDTVAIKGKWSHDHIFAGEWGVVKKIDADWFYVGIAGGDASVFKKSELKKDAINYITKLPQ